MFGFSKKEKLHYACYKGDLQSVEKIISQGFSVDAPLRGSDRALHIAAVEGHKDVVEFLISKGANIDAKGERGQSPIHYATIGFRDDNPLKGSDT